jgi:hypothetical protein
LLLEASLAQHISRLNLNALLHASIFVMKSQIRADLSVTLSLPCLFTVIYSRMYSQHVSLVSFDVCWGHLQGNNLAILVTDAFARVTAAETTVRSDRLIAVV